LSNTEKHAISYRKYQSKYTMPIDREDITADQNVLLEKKQTQKEGCTILHRHEIQVDRNQTLECCQSNYIRIWKTG
jgi:hypothetical protein